MTHAAAVDPFIQRWAASGAAERANYQLFLSELCGLVDVPPPDPTRPDDTSKFPFYQPLKLGEPYARS